MNDSLRYISKDPAYRQYHHSDLTFSMVYAYNENFVLPLSHDEVVHGKGSLLQKMPGDEWQQAANMRAYMAFMFAHPGKKMNFMGIEFAQSAEWNHNQSLDWHLLDFEKHRGMQQLFRDLNLTYRRCAPLYQLDYDTKGFGWLDHQDAAHSTLSFYREDSHGERLYVVSNFTPVPRSRFHIGVAELAEYEVILNTDSVHYWGSNFPVQHASLHSSAHAYQGQAYCLVLDLPPLATLYLRKKQ